MVIIRLLKLMFTPFAFSILLVSSIIVRFIKQKRPIVLWGPIPQKNIKYNSEAIKIFGIKSNTVVYRIHRQNSELDFDYHYKHFALKILPGFLTPYIVFIWFLFNFNILITNYNGGLLNRTHLRFLEAWFIKIAKKKLVVWPYGSDTYVYTNINDHTFRYGLYKSYPYSARISKKITRQIEYFSKNADFAVGNIPHNETCPRWDILTVGCYCVDTNEWKPPLDYKFWTNGTNGFVKIVHCPNHKYVKGTDFIINACNELKNEGLNIELIILENITNNKLREIVKQCDILAAEVIYGYATNEIEGMSLGKPVISNLENDHYFLVAKRYTYFKYCPIISATPETIKQRLKELIINPELREEIGKKSRDYVIKFHSLEGQGLMWSKIINKIWNNNEENIDFWWHERTIG